MFPSECILERRVRTDSDTHYYREQDLAAPYLPFFVLKCEDRKADGYADDELEIHNQRLQRMVIGVRLADKPPAASYLAILGSNAVAEIVAVDKTLIVISLEFLYKDEGQPEPGQSPSSSSSSSSSFSSYLIYDAVALSLRMIPQPENPYTFGSVSIARPYHGGDYALVHAGILAHDYENDDIQCDEDSDAADDEDASLFLWRPSSSSSLPWSDKKKSSFPDASVYESHTEFSFNGHAYWVDLLRGVSYCNCDALFDGNTSVVESGGFIHLPVELLSYHRNSKGVVEPCAYRTMGVSDSFIRFVSIDGFKIKKRTLTVWRLLGHDEGWEKEHEFSMETLWGFQGFRHLPKNLAPIYPLLNTNDKDVVFLALGEYHKFRGEFTAGGASYLLAVDMRKKIVTSVPLGETSDEFVSCGIGPKALVGPCDDQGVPIPVKKKQQQQHRHDIAEASIYMKMEPRMNKHICFS